MATKAKAVQTASPDATSQEQRTTGTDGQPAAEPARNRVALCVARKGATSVVFMQSGATNRPFADEGRAQEKTPETTVLSAVSGVEMERGAGGSRTHGGGFAIA